MQLHASCVAFAGQGVLICGASGSGKSGLALGLMALGADLVSDDWTEIKLIDDWPFAICPNALCGKIEARGIGILAADYLPSAPLKLVIDLDRIETERLPPDRYFELLGPPLPLLHKIESAHFAAAIRQYLLGGKAAI